MKKNLVNLLLLAFLLLAASCRSGKKYTLKMKLAEGDHFEHNLQSDVRMHYDVAGQPLNMRMRSDIACFFDVKESTPDEKQIKMTYSRSKLTMDMGDLGALLNTDSINNVAGNKMVGKSVLITLTKNNEIRDVKANWNEDIDADPRTKELVKKMVSKEQMNEMFGMMFGLYPDKPVAVGENWIKENKMNLGDFQMKIKTRYTLTAVKANSATIAIKGALSGKGTMGAKETEFVMKGAMDGKISINLATGYLQSGKYAMNMVARVHTFGQPVPISIDGSFNMFGK